MVNLNVDYSSCSVFLNEYIFNSKDIKMLVGGECKWLISCLCFMFWFHLENLKHVLKRCTSHRFIFFILRVRFSVKSYTCIIPI